MAEEAEEAAAETVTVERQGQPAAAARPPPSKSALAVTRRCTRVCSRQQEPEAATEPTGAAATARRTELAAVAGHRRPSRAAEAAGTPEGPRTEARAVARVPLAAVGPPQETPLPAAAVAADPLR